MAQPPITDLVKVEVLVPPETGGFLIGRNLVGDALTQDGVTMSWEDYLCDARSINIVRGGSQDGIVTSLDVGTASVSLVNAGNPLGPVPSIKPNRAIRITSGERDVVTTLRDVDFADATWPAELVNLASGFTATYGTDPDKGTFVNLSAAVSGTYQSIGVPNVMDVRAGDVYTMSADVRPDTAHEFNDWSVRNETSSTIDATIVNQNLTSDAWTTVSFTWTADADYPLTSFYMAIAPVLPNFWDVDVTNVKLTRFRKEAQLLYTGDIQDVYMDYDREGNEFVSFTAADGVRSVNNTQRYGAVVEAGAGFETWAARMRRLAQSANTSTNPPEMGDQERTLYTLNAYTEGQKAWTTFNKPSRITWYDNSPYAGNWTSAYGGHSIYARPRLTSATTAFTLTAGTWGIQKTVTGLTPGRKYAFSGTVVNRWNTWSWLPDEFMIGVSGIGWGDPVKVTKTTNNTGKILRYEFVATSTSHTLQLAYGENTSVPAGYPKADLGIFFLVAPTLTEYVENIIVLQDTAYEGALAEHFNIASNSVGAVWWADKSNVIQFKRALDADLPVANFGDVHMGTEPTVLAKRTNYANWPSPDTGATWSTYALAGTTLTKTFETSTPVGGLVRNILKVVVNGTSTTTGDQYIFSPYATYSNQDEPPTFKAGTQYTASVYVRCSQAVTLKPSFNIQDGGSSTNGVDVSVAPNTWTRVSATRTVSQNGTFTAQMFVRLAGTTPMASGTVIEYGAFMVEEGSTPGPWFDGSSADTLETEHSWDPNWERLTFQSGPGPSFQLIYDTKPILTNLVPTPSFENGVGNWGGTNCTVTTTNSFPQMAGRVGNYILQAVSTGAATSMYPWAEFPIDPADGSCYSYKAWIATDAALRVRQVVYFYDETGALINPTQGGDQNTGAQFYAGRTIRYSGQVPENAVKMRIYFTATNDGVSGNVPAGKRIWVDQVHVEQADTQAEAEERVATYFDGDTAGDFYNTYEWLGTPHASPSRYTPVSYDPLHVCYTNIQGDYATANVVNDLTVANHGRNPVDGNTLDVNYRKQDITSVVSWGSRSATVDTSIYNDGAFAGSVDVRAKEITDEWGTPEVSISSVTFDARNAIDRVDLIDIFSRVVVNFKGNTYVCRVTKITHDIQPDRWLTTLELRKD